ncbi:hypothetical protein DBV05_g9049 [Lasiodiplodia theobromae]|uniref:Uncharacterized protein n=1 Tax=Lasiodiplodia theobromae TaxID=45133 RepID=A0A5N5D4G8_9PEZI|nr:hypothetical protein DBV05_g9049 [Lasiodiplodia theobromae]
MPGRKHYKPAGRPQYTNLSIKAVENTVLASALRDTQRRFDTFADHEPINDPNSWLNELAWSSEVKKFAWPDDIRPSPRDKIISAVQASLNSYQSNGCDHFAFSDCLCIWDISKLCSQEKFFRSPAFGSAFCVQFSSFTPHVVKMGLVEGELGVFLKQDVCVPISQFLEVLRGVSPSFAPCYDTQLKFWESKVTDDKTKFNYSGLPRELRWMIIEHLGEDTDLWPYLYKRGDARSRYSCAEDARRVGLMTITPVQYQYVMNGIGIFRKGTHDELMLLKTSIRRNTFCFDRPGNLVRFLDAVDGSQLSNIRKVHFNFDHADFLSFFGANIQPGEKHYGRFAKALKTLGQLHLDTVWIEPKVSEDMTIKGYFPRPQEFGCHMKAVRYICGLITRNLQNAKRLKLCGSYFRQSWQGALDEMFFDAKRAEFISGKFYALKADKPNGEGPSGGARVSKKRRKHNKSIVDAEHTPYDAAIDLPEEELGVLWPCGCHDPCGPDHFNSSERPEKKAVEEVEETGGEE